VWDMSIINTERMIQYRARLPRRKCECGALLDKYCDYCSDCSVARREINQNVYRHEWKINNPEKVRESYNYFNRKDVKVFNRLLRKLEAVE